MQPGWKQPNLARPKKELVPGHREGPSAGQLDHPGGVGPLAAIRLLVLPASRHDPLGTGVRHRRLLRSHAGDRPCRRRLAVEAKGSTGVRRPKPARSALRHADRSRKAPLPISRRAFDGPANCGRKRHGLQRPSGDAGRPLGKAANGSQNALVGSALLRPILLFPKVSWPGDLRLGTAGPFGSNGFR